jgi:hypothetical protein
MCKQNIGIHGYTNKTDTVYNHVSTVSSRRQYVSQTSVFIIVECDIYSAGSRLFFLFSDLPIHVMLCCPIFSELIYIELIIIQILLFVQTKNQSKKYEVF